MPILVCGYLPFPVSNWKKESKAVIFVFPITASPAENIVIIKLIIKWWTILKTIVMKMKHAHES